jgi:hypothetical protein
MQDHSLFHSSWKRLQKGSKRLTKKDVFDRSSDSEWAAPTFIQAEKTGDESILRDFRRLNAQIKRVREISIFASLVAFYVYS